MTSIEQQLYSNNRLYYNQAGGGGMARLKKDAEAVGNLQRAYSDPMSATKGNLLASAMNSLKHDDQIGGVQGWRIKQDLAQNEAAARTRRRLNSLQGDELNDELKRLEAMTPRTI